MQERFILWLCLIAACQNIACTREPEPKPNILIVLVDTLRADRLGVYGRTRALTPFLESLADRGHVFHNAYAQSPWTNPSVASLLTSRYQSQHGVVSLDSVLTEAEHTLPEVLREHGYATAGFSANLLVHTNRGFGQGFDQYRTLAHSAPRESTGFRNIKGRAEQVSKAGLTWLDGLSGKTQREPVLLYLHYMEPHSPYGPPEAILDRVLGDRPHPDLALANTRMRLASLYSWNDQQVQSIEDLYDAEVISLDTHLRALFTELDSRGFFDNAIVVITADHGEEFMEHGRMGHDKALYNEVIHVPLLILLPGQTKRVEITSAVELTDIAPTLLDLLETPAPPSFEGRSLVGALRGGTRDRWSFAGLRQMWKQIRFRPQPVYSELIKPTERRGNLPHERTAIIGPLKIITSIDGKREFYDLGDDPGETNPQALAEAERGRLATALDQLTQRAALAPAPRQTKALDAETKEHLRLLGYTE